MKLEEDFLKNGGEFKTCLAKSLFEIKTNPQLDKDSFIFSNNSKYPYFTRTVFNNGILGYVDYLDDSHLIKGNALAVGLMGMRFFYMKDDFYAGQFTKTAYPLFAGFNEKVALWFISWLDKSSPKYKSLLVRDFDEAFNNTKLVVPFKDNQVAVDYIGVLIHEIERSRIIDIKNFLEDSGLYDKKLTQAEKNAITEIKEGTKLLRKFRIVEEFNVTNSYNILKSDVVYGSGTVPYVTASEGNNSIVSYISYDPNMLEKGNSIMIGGKTLVVTYQPDDFYSNDSHNLVLTINNEEGRTESAQLYMVASLYKSLSPKYSWGDSISKAKIQSDELFLPVTENGGIDFAFMETYINALKKQIIARLKSNLIKDKYTEENAILAPKSYIPHYSISNEVSLAAESFELYKIKDTDQKITDLMGFGKTILVGCYKNKQHLEWITSHNIYNIRLGKRKGSMEKESSLFTKTSLLVLYNISCPSKLFVYEIKGCQEVSGADLKKIDYPNSKAGKRYMIFNLRLSSIETKSLVDSHLIEKLTTRSSTHIKGVPIFLEP